MEVSSYQLELSGSFHPKVLSTSPFFSSFHCLVFVLHLRLEPFAIFQAYMFLNVRGFEIRDIGWKSHMVGSIGTGSNSSHTDV